VVNVSQGNTGKSERIYFGNDSVEEVNGRCSLIKGARTFFSYSFFEIFSILSIHYCS